MKLLKNTAQKFGVASKVTVKDFYIVKIYINVLK